MYRDSLNRVDNARIRFLESSRKYVYRDSFNRDDSMYIRFTESSRKYVYRDSLNRVERTCLGIPLIELIVHVYVSDSLNRAESVSEFLESSRKYMYKIH